MHNGLKYIFALSIGAAIGSAVTWKVIKTKYERIAQEEIDSVKEYYLEKYGKQANSKEKPSSKEDNKAMIDGYANNIDEYVSHSDANDEKGDSDSMDDFGPEVITPDEFGEINEYDTISLTYYADEVLTDDMDIPIEDIGETVGYSFADHFGEYEDDSVFIRNHRLKCDYEILMDERKYSELESDDLNPEDD